MCMDCAGVCPKNAIHFGNKTVPENKPIPVWGYESDPTRREFLGALAVGGAAVVALNMGLMKTDKRMVIRPPGVAANEADFLSKCIRCGQCVEGCPNQALHPLVLEAGLDGMGTPAFNHTLGGCSYDCNRCGQICPAGAIPNLTLEQKRKQVMGKVALVDENMCKGCMACQKICPIEGTVGVKMVDRGNRKIRIPVIAENLCIGCGACVRECPVPNLMYVHLA